MQRNKSNINEKLDLIVSHFSVFTLQQKIAIIDDYDSLMMESNSFVETMNKKNVRLSIITYNNIERTKKQILKLEESHVLVWGKTEHISALNNSCLESNLQTMMIHRKKLTYTDCETMCSDQAIAQTTMQENIFNLSNSKDHATISNWISQGDIFHTYIFKNHAWEQSQLIDLFATVAPTFFNSKVLTTTPELKYGTVWSKILTKQTLVSKVKQLCLKFNCSRNDLMLMRDTACTYISNEEFILASETFSFIPITIQELNRIIKLATLDRHRKIPIKLKTQFIKSQAY
jgi:hypothetical protein